MKIRNLFTTALLVSAGTALVGPAAYAGSLTYSNGDIFLGFRSTAGTGTSTDYEVDLGNASSFITGGTLASGSPITLSIGNIGTDLANIFGPDWYTRVTGTGTDVLWSASGSAAGIAVNASIPKNTLFATSAVFPAPTSYNPGSSLNQQTTAQLMAAMRGDTGHGYGAGDTIGGPGQTLSTVPGVVALIQPTSAPNSYASYQPGGVNSATGSFQRFLTSAEGQTSDTLNFYELLPGTSSPIDVGSFSLGSNGALTFTATPEPATAISLAFGLGFLSQLRLRRRVKN